MEIVAWEKSLFLNPIHKIFALSFADGQLMFSNMNNIAFDAFDFVQIDDMRAMDADKLR